MIKNYSVKVYDFLKSSVNLKTQSHVDDVESFWIAFESKLKKNVFKCVVIYLVMLMKGF